MSVDEISEIISNLEWDDLIRIQSKITDRGNHLNRLELQKFKKGDYVKIKDTEGNYRDGMVMGFTSKQVRVEIGREHPVSISPHSLTKWAREAKELEEAPG